MSISDHPLLRPPGPTHQKDWTARFGPSRPITIAPAPFRTAVERRYVRLQPSYRDKRLGNASASRGGGFAPCCRDPRALSRRHQRFSRGAAPSRSGNGLVTSRQRAQSPRVLRRYFSSRPPTPNVGRAGFCPPPGPGSASSRLAGLAPFAFRPAAVPRRHGPANVSCQASASLPDGPANDPKLGAGNTLHLYRSADGAMPCFAGPRRMVAAPGLSDDPAAAVDGSRNISLTPAASSLEL